MWSSSSGGQQPPRSGFSGSAQNPYQQQQQGFFNDRQGYGQSQGLQAQAPKQYTGFSGQSMFQSQQQSPIQQQSQMQPQIQQQSNLQNLGYGARPISGAQQTQLQAPQQQQQPVQLTQVQQLQQLLARTMQPQQQLQQPQQLSQQLQPQQQLQQQPQQQLQQQPLSQQQLLQQLQYRQGTTQGQAVYQPQQVLQQQVQPGQQYGQQPQLQPQGQMQQRPQLQGQQLQQGMFGGSSMAQPSQQRPMGHGMQTGAGADLGGHLGAGGYQHQQQQQPTNNYSFGKEFGRPTGFSSGPRPDQQGLSMVSQAGGGPTARGIDYGRPTSADRGDRGRSPPTGLPGPGGRDRDMGGRAMRDMGRQPPVPSRPVSSQSPARPPPKTSYSYAKPRREREKEEPLRREDGGRKRHKSPSPRRDEPHKRERRDLKERDKDKDREKDRDTVSRDRDTKDKETREKEADKDRERERDRVKDRSRSRSVEKDREKEKKYLVKLSSHTFAQHERSYLDLKRRYPHLHLAPDFTHLVASWTEIIPHSRPRLSLYQPLKFVCDTQNVDSQAAAVGGDKANNVFYQAKIMILSGPATLLTDSTSAHLANVLKFLVCKRGRSELMCIGGSWSATLDGGDPSDPSDPCLIRTAIRCTKEQMDLDLSSWKHWVRFMEVHYARIPDASASSQTPHKEITVLFLPYASSLNPFLTSEEALISSGSPSGQSTAMAMDLALPGGSEADPTSHPHLDQFSSTNGPAAADGPTAPHSLGPPPSTAPASTPTTTNPDEISSAAADSHSQDVAANPNPTTGSDAADLSHVPASLTSATATATPVATTTTTGDASTKQEPAPAPALAFPANPGELEIRVTTKSSKQSKFRARVLSLDGLLEYDESDRFEATFEVSLFAELFQEMLQQDFGWILYEALLVAFSLHRRKPAAPPASTRNPTAAPTATATATTTTTDTTKKADDQSAAAGEPTHPKPETEEPRPHPDATHPQTATGNDTSAPVLSTDVAESGSAAETASEAAHLEGMEPGEVHGEGSASLMETHQSHNHLEPAEPTAIPIIPPMSAAELRRAFRWFDRNDVGYIKCEDMETILHCLGECWSRRYIHQLVSKAAEFTTPEGADQKKPRIYFAPLIEKLYAPTHRE